MLLSLLRCSAACDSAHDRYRPINICSRIRLASSVSGDKVMVGNLWVGQSLRLVLAGVLMGNKALWATEKPVASSVLL